MRLINANKKFISKNEEIIILNNVSIEFKKGTMYLITGHSGSGKTTLINILGLIDKLDTGKLLIDNIDINNLNNKEIVNIRKEKIGFIFQDYCLNEYLTAKENIIVPMLVNKNIKSKDRNNIAINLLEQFNLSNRANHLPKKLSGGEKQRVSIARALVNNPKYLICDEPTGALDKKNERIVFEYLKKLAKSGICVIVVSHSNEIKKYADKTYILEDGIISEVKNEDN